MSQNNSYINSELYNYEFFMKDNVCRLCWKTNTTKNIFTNEEYHKTKPNQKIWESIQYCLNISIEYGSVPSKICKECLETVEKYNNFKLLCIETNKRLEDIFRNPTYVEIKQEKEDYNEMHNEDSNDNACLPSPQSSDSDNEPLINQNNKTETKKRHYNKKKHPSTYCKKCKIDYKTRDNYTKHNKDFHGIIDGLYQCFGCDKKFHTRKTRTGHEIKFCKGLINGYLCRKCDRYLPKRSMFESHILKHEFNDSIELPEDIFTCIKCKMTFKSRNVLMKHFEEQHKKKKRFVCELCGRVFKRMDYLHKHMMAHNGLKKHICSHCGYRATQKSSLNVHLRKHTGIKPFSCDLCPMKCTSSSNLLAHKKRHAGVKKYECTICPKKFGYKTSLEEHVAATHDHVKNYSCNICNTSYSRSGGLRRHLRFKHNTKFNECISVVKDKIDEINDSFVIKNISDDIFISYNKIE